KANLSKRHFKEALAPSLLRNYKIYLPNQVWSIDITYIRLNHGHIYLTALIDWYSRKIIGWSLSDTLEKETVIHVVEAAVAKYGNPAIINSDQGGQFSSEEYRETLKRLNIRQSMDGKSRWADNIMIERWFRSLKTELIYINEFKSPRELKKAIREYIAGYNGKRPHEALDYKTPDEVYASKFVA
ncbi:MAG: IS3 family transposase, partial [Pyramidobacter sp.]|nr:IS3 family transposase [Pyramidobacter sp.]